MGYDYDQTHEKIVESAITHFTAKGFSGASIRQICKDAGVTNGAFYAHFESKEDLFSSIVSPVVEGMKEIYDTENSHYKDINSVEDVKDVLKQTFSSNRRLIRYVFAHADIFGIILSGGAGTEYEDFCDDLAVVFSGLGDVLADHAVEPFSLQIIQNLLNLPERSALHSSDAFELTLELTDSYL